MNRLLVAVLLVSTFAFAGCVASDAKTIADDGQEVPAEAAPPQFAEDTGAIQGIVIDQEANPLSGVQVAIVGGEVAAEAVSAIDGRFGLNNLPPGKHVVAAQKLGYESASKMVEVRVGEVTEATFSLSAIQVVESYHNIIPYKGYFDCTWSNPTGSGPCGYIGATNGTTGNPLQPLWVNSKRKWNWPIAANSLTILHEVTWTKGSFATGEKMSVIMSHGPIDGKERDGTHNWCTTAGKNPVRMHWERPTVEDDGDCLTGGQQNNGNNGPKEIDPAGTLMQSFVSTGAGANPATGGDLPVGGAYQQSFELLITVFYGEVAPEGFTALADG